MSLPAGGLLQFRESSGTLGGSFESLIMPSRVVSRWWLGAMPIISQDLRILLRLGEHHGHFLIGGVSYFLRFGLSLRGIGGCDVVTFGDHALVDSGLIVTGQIQFFGFKGKDLDTVLVQRGADVIQDRLGQFPVTAGDHFILTGAADDIFGRVINNGIQPAFRIWNRAVQSLGEFQGVGDIPKDVAVTDHGLLVAGNDIGCGQVIEQDLFG